MKFLLQPARDTLQGLEHLLLQQRPWPSVAVAVLAFVAAWFVYVPVHELLHVAGCVLSGGTVQELQVAPQYGGALLARLFPFVVVGGEYAGRLSDFEHFGNDGIYLLTVFMPFVLTIVVGVPLLRRAAGGPRPVSFGVGVIVGLAPFMQLQGDYHEMASIAVTRVWSWWTATELAIDLRSDDVFKVVHTWRTAPDEMALGGVSAAAAPWAIGLACFSAVVLAFLTYGAGWWWSRCLGQRPVAVEGAPEGPA